MESELPTDIELKRMMRVNAWFTNNRDLFVTDRSGLDMMCAVHRLVCECIEAENKPNDPMEKLYRVTYIGTLNNTTRTYDLMAVDRADAIHLTLRRFPYLIVMSAEIVL